MTLRQLHPTLMESAALDALSLCSATRPLMLFVEDINKSGQAPFLADRWDRRARESGPPRRHDQTLPAPPCGLYIPAGLPEVSNQT